jgi:hypothetical protein
MVAARIDVADRIAIVRKVKCVGTRTNIATPVQQGR